MFECFVKYNFWKSGLLKALHIHWNLIWLTFLIYFLFTTLEIIPWSTRPVTSQLVTLINSAKKYFNFDLVTLCKNCPYSELFWSVFSRIPTEHRERYVVSLCIQSEYGKVRIRKTSNRDTFQAVWLISEKQKRKGEGKERHLDWMKDF